MNGVTGIPAPGTAPAPERTKNDPAAIRKAAKEMESLFAYEMIKSMKAGTGIGTGGLGGDTYLTLFQLELSKLLADRGLGLQDMLAKGLTSMAGAREAGRSPVEQQAPPAASQAAAPLTGSLMHGSGGISAGSGPRRDPAAGALTVHPDPAAAAQTKAPVYPFRSGTAVPGGNRRAY